MNYISDENKLKKRLNKRSLYVQSLRTPAVDKNIDIIGDVSIPRPVQQVVQQVSNYGSSGGTEKSIVNIINALISQISQISQMFTKQVTYTKTDIDADYNYIERDPNNAYILFLSFRFADNYLMSISKIKVLFNELRDTYESFLKSVNPNKKVQFTDIINSIIKYFEFWNPFYKSLDISIELTNGTSLPLNEYIYNNINSNTISYVTVNGIPSYLSRIGLYNKVPFSTPTEITSNFIDINYNYNDILKIIYDTLGPFIDKLKINNQETYKNIQDAEHEKAQLIKDKAIKEQEINDYKNNEIDKTQQSINMFTIGIPNAEKELKDQKNKIIASTKKIYDIFKNEHLDKITANAYVILVRQKHHTPEEADTLKRITDLMNAGDLLTVEGLLKDIDVSEVEIQKANAFLNTAYDELKKFTNKKFEQVAVLQKLEKELYKINQQILLVENYINKTKTNEDYTPKKGSGRGQSIKYIPKKGSGRSQYVDPYDRSIPKRYM